MGERVSRVDVAVVGAGPAGCAAAICLARAHRRVVVFEKQAAGSTKACGGCLSGRALQQLRDLLDADRALPGVDGTGILFAIGSYRIHYRPRGVTWLAPRAELDTALAEAASTAGADVRFGQAATIARVRHGWDVLAGGERFEAERVLLATGLTGLTRVLGVQARRCHLRMIAQQWVQPADPPLPALGAVEMHWLRGGYIGLATPKAKCCVVALAAETTGAANESVLEQLHRLNPSNRVWDGIPPDATRRYRAKGIGCFPWRPAVLGAGNVLLIGDAAGYEEPFTGEGIGKALCSGAWAAEATIGGDDVLRRYTLGMRRYHRVSHLRLRLVARLLRGRAVQHLASRRPVLPRAPFLRLIEHVHARG